MSATNLAYCVECENIGKLIDSLVVLISLPQYEHEERLQKLLKLLRALIPLLYVYSAELKYDYKDLRDELETIHK
jgi:hypothetical protein